MGQPTEDGMLFKAFTYLGVSQEEIINMAAVNTSKFKSTNHLCNS